SNSQRVDHATFAHLCGVHQEAVTTPADCLSRVRAAFYRAAAESRPVLLTVPMDVQEQELDQPYAYVASTDLVRQSRRVAPEAGALDDAAGLLLSSRRPVIVLGEG